MAPHPFCFPGAGRTFASRSFEPAYGLSKHDRHRSQEDLRQPQRSAHQALRAQRARHQRARAGDRAPVATRSCAPRPTAFKQRLANGETLDQLLPEAFAVVREAGKRTLNMRHFDVQLIGGMVLHYGKIAEMRTGEGKTLVATLPAYLNALAGEGVHVVTVNDYLASRDAAWMGRLYGFLGLTVGVNLSQMDHASKQQAYAADITYGTNNEFGFDYLRDNMVYADRRPGAAQARLRHRRRGRLHPDRRSAHAADHLRPGRGHHRPVLQDQRSGAQAHPPGQGERGRATLAWTRKRTRCCSPKPGTSTPRSCSPSAGLLPEGSSLYDAGQHHAHASRVRGPACARAVPPRPALRGAERRSHHRRRVHRAPDARAALVRRPAPGGGSQGRRAHPAREPDARLDHLPELLPHVQEAGRHDRDGRHRSLRVPADLQPGDGGHPHPHGR